MLIALLKPLQNSSLLTTKIDWNKSVFITDLNCTLSNFEPLTTVRSFINVIKVPLFLTANKYQKQNQQKQQMIFDDFAIWKYKHLMYLKI